MKRLMPLKSPFEELLSGNGKNGFWGNVAAPTCTWMILDFTILNGLSCLKTYFHINVINWCEFNHNRIFRTVMYGDSVNDEFHAEPMPEVLLIFFPAQSSLFWIF